MTAPYQNTDGAIHKGGATMAGYSYPNAIPAAAAPTPAAAPSTTAAPNMGNVPMAKTVNSGAMGAGLDIPAAPSGPVIPPSGGGSGGGGGGSGGGSASLAPPPVTHVNNLPAAPPSLPLLRLQLLLQAHLWLHPAILMGRFLATMSSQRASTHCASNPLSRAQRTSSLYNDFFSRRHQRN